jgi:hydrogenase-4 component B
MSDMVALSLLLSLFALSSLVLAPALGVLFGVGQRDAKVLLAYSSISQMGFMTLGVGAGLAQPAAWPAISTGSRKSTTLWGMTRATRC